MNFIKLKANQDTNMNCEFIRLINNFYEQSFEQNNIYLFRQPFTKDQQNIVKYCTTNENLYSVLEHEILDSQICCIVMPEYITWNYKWIDFRQKLINYFMIDYVVPLSESETLIVFQKSSAKTDKINFIKKDGTFICKVLLEQLEKTNYSLNFKQYVPSEDDRLGDYHPMYNY